MSQGIRLDHKQFQYSAADRERGLTGSRALAGFSSFGDGDTEDCVGHGSHVAGIIGGLTFGVAKNATLYAGDLNDRQEDSTILRTSTFLQFLSVNE